ncbi:MAG: DEAD/DEAH box helicase [Alicyclobacillus macrosporangiidus]|uniref:DEAD/DEAH box helicase n=1 Tax=Alicyclobacillus macrosporangiidus TaxID=392015 RepID=UPI0026ED1515|nr:DEAD/DEAH box helicase [Alicyclobacillus macrosporangiidus]MCL6597255.1 DEAD/DEAH box helicase [Alicyclobacillus macrosporangiidus]
MNLATLLDEWRRTPEMMRNVAHWHVEPARIARFRAIPDWVHADLRAALQARSIRQLYAHQAEALEAVHAGRHTMVVTPTASGKTLCYNLPVIDTILKDATARALYLFPTKALSQDQVAELHELCGRLPSPVQSFTYDGDTPLHARQRIREAGHIVVTNPDMLHAAILPHHTKWLRLFENLRYIVIDEAHIYRGVFGSHVANVVRRLRRICRHYGSDPVFILCSATIANPGELAAELTGEEVAVVDQSGAPQGERHTIFYNPPLVQPELGLRRSPLLEARRFGTRLVREGISTIAFVKTRTQVELLATYWKADVPERLRDRVFGYRGGYLPNERRRIERGLRDGEILGVVSTNALELGVDIGSLEASITVGYPGTIASFRQQSGRAGRRHGVSAALFIANASAIDQYMVQHPEHILEGVPEAARLYPENLLILTDHLKCAAYELPFSQEERFGVETTGELLEYLAHHRVLHQGRDGRYFWMSDALPSHNVSLRSAAQDNVVIIDQTAARPQVIGETDRFSALTTLHEEAIYLHQSRPYQVERLDLENGKAYVRQVDVDYYTDAELAVRLQVLDVLADKPAGAAARHHTGELMVNAVPTLFKKIKFDTHENLGWGKIHLPEAELHTVGYWCRWDKRSIPWDNERWETALMGLAHVLRHAAALHCMCAIGDLHWAAEVRDPLDGQPTLYLYDAYPGGVGLAERVFRDTDPVFAIARAMVADCPCEAGCPSCIGPGRGDHTAKALVLRLIDESRTAEAAD